MAVFLEFESHERGKVTSTPARYGWRTLRPPPLRPGAPRKGQPEHE
jgi:hypothetical protein